MRKAVVLTLATVLITLTLALPAMAQTEKGDIAADEAYLKSMTEKFMPKGTPLGVTIILAWDPILGKLNFLGIYELAALCNAHGGYYYPDPYGDWHRHEC